MSHPTNIWGGFLVGLLLLAWVPGAGAGGGRQAADPASPGVEGSSWAGAPGSQRNPAVLPVREADAAGRSWTRLSSAASEALARDRLDHCREGGVAAGLSDKKKECPLSRSLFCLLGWGQGLCEGGLCSDRLWALPPAPRRTHRGHCTFSSRPFTFCSPPEAWPCIHGAGFL